VEKVKRQIGSQKGYTLAVVMVFTSVLLVTLSKGVLNWQMAMKREREEELIFRGKQYQRALVLWHRHFSKTLGTSNVPYPSTLDALLHTNNKRFLRKKWKDPVANSNTWRFIKVNPTGRGPILSVQPEPIGFPSQSKNLLGASQSQITRRGETGESTSLLNQTAYGQQLKPLTSSVIGGIAGVASTSEEETLKTFNGRNKYNEWEFYIDFRALNRQAQPPQSSESQQQPSQPEQMRQKGRFTSGQPRSPMGGHPKSIPN
tara:strand:+ start:451 stop:1227 length:777 start_codon:yes stop_codon:yes gene_type:complete